jgi:hypothetical protein
VKGNFNLVGGNKKKGGGLIAGLLSAPAKLVGIK